MQDSSDTLCGAVACAKAIINGVCLVLRAGRHILTELVADTYIPADITVHAHKGRVQVILLAMCIIGSSDLYSLLLVHISLNKTHTFFIHRLSKLACFLLSADNLVGACLELCWCFWYCVHVKLPS